MPPQPIRELRDTTRYRTEVVRERTREVQCLEKLLEDAGVKLSSVVSDIVGKSGRAMLEAMVAGECDPLVLAELAMTRMRGKREILAEALRGRFTDHHAFMVRAMLDRIDACTATEVRLSTRIDAQVRPFRRRIELLVTIPGMNTRAAEVVLAEIGADIARFPNAADLASWAGVCPGNHESAGKRSTGKTRHGDPWLKGALGQAAGASRWLYRPRQCRRRDCPANESSRWNRSPSERRGIPAVGRAPRSNHGEAFNSSSSRTRSAITRTSRFVLRTGRPRVLSARDPMDSFI